MSDPLNTAAMARWIGGVRGWGIAERVLDVLGAVMLLSIWSSLALAVPTQLGSVGDGRFWHRHPVTDVHVGEDGVLQTFSGCAVYRWSAAGERLGTARLKGCTAGLNDGVFSPDGAWIAASGLWVGQQGVWRTTGGARVHEVETISFARLCAGALWDVDGPRGLRRLDLVSGEVTHPTGDHGTDFVCVGDAWLFDAHGHRIDPDGGLTELLAEDKVFRVVGQTDDQRAIAYANDGHLWLVDRDGGLEVSVPVPDVPEKALVHGGDVFVLDDGVDDVVWGISADSGRIVRGPEHAEGQGLGMRNGLGALFEWNGRLWSFGGHRVFPLGAPTGPLDSVFERFFLDNDELYLCHGTTCEVRPLAALDQADAVRMLHLPDRIDDDGKLSPHHRYLGLFDTRSLYRVVLDTGEVQVQAVPEWVDGLSIDARGHFRWRLSSDEDDDGTYITRIYEQGNGGPVVLGEWTETWLADPGWSLLQVSPTMRWPDGRSVGYDDADNWLETPAGLAVIARLNGRGLEVYGTDGQLVAQSGKPVDNLGAWGQGVWVGRDQKVHFLGPDLREHARLTIPWKLDMFAVEGAASPDGRHFAARAPDGRIVVWALDSPYSVGPLPAPEPLAAASVPLKVGDPLGAPKWEPPAVRVVPDYDDAVAEGLSPRQLERLAELPDVYQTVAAMAAFAPQTQQERLAWLAAIRTLPVGLEVKDVDLYSVKSAWLAARTGGKVLDDDGEWVDPDAAASARDLALLVRGADLQSTVPLMARWQALQRVGAGPAFGLPECHDLAVEPGATLPIRPAGVAEKDLHEAILVKVSAEGTPTWVGTVSGTSARDARECWQAHDDPWTPARREGQPLEMCVVVGCR